MKKLAIIILTFILFPFLKIEVIACSRITYFGKNGISLTARTMDWQSDFRSNIWILPKGIKRDGGINEKSIQWTTKYGSVVTSIYDIASVDGINEMGLSAGLLWLQESDYGKWTGQKEGMIVSLWLQYVLDNFATVNEAVTQLQKDEFTLITAQMPGTNESAHMHLGISDTSGDNAVVEYIDGKIKIYHSKEYNVLTNSPSYDQQIVINKYWQSVWQQPGENVAANRFAIASYYLNQINKTEDYNWALSAVRSVIRNVAGPIGIKASEDAPNISSTIWTTVCDHQNKLYYFESPYTLNTIWIDLNNLDFSEGAPCLKLDLQDKTKTYIGNVNGDLKESKPFEFITFETLKNFKL